MFLGLYLPSELHFGKGNLKSGLKVAVKTLSAESKQGLREFLSEINTIANVKHPNLVELIGCCVEGANRTLVYEYAVNNSLDHALLGKIINYSKKLNNLTNNFSLPSMLLSGSHIGSGFGGSDAIKWVPHR